jgi:predicted MFS family arabinose efflux permease
MITDRRKWVVLSVLIISLFSIVLDNDVLPSLDVRLFHDPRLSLAAAAIGLNFYAMSGVYFFMRFYLQNVRGYSPMPTAHRPVAVLVED